MLVLLQNNWKDKIIRYLVNIEWWDNGDNDKLSKKSNVKERKVLIDNETWKINSFFIDWKAFTFQKIIFN